MKYQLKPGQDSFEIVDGPSAGQKFRRDRLYDPAQVPPEFADRFEALEPTGAWVEDTPAALMEDKK